MIYVDSNVIIDVLGNDPVFASTSAAALSRPGKKLVGPIAFAELSYGMSSAAHVSATLSAFGLDFEDMPQTALFQAGQAFRAYRQRGGARNSILPDFFIGAQAFVAGRPLLTRDPARFRTAFPDLQLIEP